jgi:hypothetical protein
MEGSRSVQVMDPDRGGFFYLAASSGLSLTLVRVPVSSDISTRTSYSITMESLPVFLNDINIFVSTVVDPDPNGSETYRRIWIRFCNEFEVKLLRKTGKRGQFLIKKTQFKSINTFLSKNIPIKRYISS